MNFDFSNLSPEIMQMAYKMYNYVNNNMESIRTLLVDDPEFKSQKALNLINEFGAIKYPEKSYLDRQKLVREELKQIVPELQKIKQ